MGELLDVGRCRNGSWLPGYSHSTRSLRTSRLLPIALIMLVAATWIDKGLGFAYRRFHAQLCLRHLHPICQTFKECMVALGVYAVGALVLSPALENRP